MIVLNPFLDSLCNFGFKNIGLTPGVPKRCFQHPQDVVYILKRSLEKLFGKNYLLKYPPKTAITVTRNAKIPTYKIATIPGNLTKVTNTNFFLAFNCKKIHIMFLMNHISCQ